MDIYKIFYYGFIGLGAVMSAVEGAYLGKKKGFSRQELMTYIPLAIICGILGAFLMGRLQTFIISFTPLPNYNNRMRIFGGLIFTPVAVYLCARYLRADFDRISDILAPGAYLILGFAKLGCASFGCCHGREWEYGIASRFTDYKVFPVQLLESLLCFIIFAAVFLIVIKEKHRSGTVYGLSLVLYGAVRFFAEYLRDYTPAERTYFFGMNFWQLCCIVSAAAGAIWFIHKYRGRCRAEQNNMRQCEE